MRREPLFRGSEILPLATYSVKLARPEVLVQSPISRQIARRVVLPLPDNICFSVAIARRANLQDLGPMRESSHLQLQNFTGKLNEARFAARL